MPEDIKKTEAKDKYIAELELLAYKSEFDAAFALDGIPAVEKLIDEACNIITSLEEQIIPIKASHKREDRDRVKEIEKEQETISNRVKQYEGFISSMRQLNRQHINNAITYGSKAEFIKNHKEDANILPESENKSADKL